MNTPNDNQDPQTAIDYNLYPSSARPSGLHVPQAEQPTDLEIKALKEQVESLEKRVAELDAINKHACEDWAEDDTAIRDLCRPFLTEKTCDHDGYAVVPIQDAVKNALESLEKQNQAMRDVLRMCCTTRMEASETEIWNLARQALSTTAGRNYKSPEEVAAIVAWVKETCEFIRITPVNPLNDWLRERNELLRKAKDII